MEDALLVQVDKRLENLVGERFDLFSRKGLSLGLDVLLEVELQVLENQVERLLRVEYFLESVWE